MEARKRRNSGDRDSGAEQHRGRNRNFLGEPAHFSQVLLAREGVDYASGPEEQQGFEERVRHYVEDACGEGSRAKANEHVAQLGNSRISEHFLDVCLRQPDGSGDKCRRDANVGDDFQRESRVQVNLRAACDHVNARGHHGGGVNERAYRRRASHGVR